MSQLSVAEAKEAIYASLAADNADLDIAIANLKRAMVAEGAKEAEFEPSRLAQNNRAGRKTMQAYFRQRGVKVVFAGV